MNKPSDQKTTGQTNDQTQPRKDAPSFESDQQDPRESAPDLGKKSDIGKTYQPDSAKDPSRDPSKAPMQAARGDDDMMSKKPGKPA